MKREDELRSSNTGFLISWFILLIMAKTTYAIAGGQGIDGDNKTFSYLLINPVASTGPTKESLNETLYQCGIYFSTQMIRKLNQNNNVSNPTNRSLKTVILEKNANFEIISTAFDSIYYLDEDHPKNYLRVFSATDNYVHLSLLRGVPGSSRLARYSACVSQDEWPVNLKYTPMTSSVEIIRKDIASKISCNLLDESSNRGASNGSVTEIIIDSYVDCLANGISESQFFNINIQNSDRLTKEETSNITNSCGELDPLTFDGHNKIKKMGRDFFKSLMENKTRLSSILNLCQNAESNNIFGPLLTKQIMENTLAFLNSESEQRPRAKMLRNLMNDFRHSRGIYGSYLIFNLFDEAPSWKSLNAAHIRQTNQVLFNKSIENANDLILSMIHELVHNVDTKAEEASRFFSDQANLQRIESLTQKFRSVRDINGYEDKTFIQRWVRSGIERDLLGEARAWTKTYLIYQEGLMLGIWGRSDHLESIRNWISTANRTSSVQATVNIEAVIAKQLISRSRSYHLADSAIELKPSKVKDVMLSPLIEEELGRIKENLSKGFQ